MIFLKKYNFFTGTPNHISSVLLEVVNFLEVDNYNYVLFTPNKEKSCGLIYGLHSCILFNNFEEFEELVNDKSNLFRVNLIVIDLYQYKSHQVTNFLKVIEKLDYKFIIIAKEYHYKSTDDVNDFHVEIKYNLDPNITTPTSFNATRNLQSKFIKDNINGWTTELDKLKGAYIRDKKIDSLFDDEK
jgi:hypothetical protein